jgi:hypothetical protein
MPNGPNPKPAPQRSAVANPERRCTATAKSTGSRCKRYAIAGGTVCVRHGGMAPHVKRKAQERLQLAKARKAMEQHAAMYGAPEEGKSPDVALLEEVARTAGHVQWLAEKVASLEESEMKQYTRQQGGLLFERPAIWVELYQAERKHLVDACKTAIAAGIAERQVRVAEETGQMIATVIRGVLGDLNLTADQQRIVPSLVRRHLSLVRAS